MEVDLHVSAEESEESRHSLGLNLAITGGVEVLPGLVKILLEVVLGLSSLKSKMSSNDFVSSSLGILLLENEFTGWLSFWGGFLEGIVVDHGVHEHILSVWVPGSSRVVSLWDLSVIVAKSFSSDEIVMVGLKSWMWVLLTPFGGNIVTSKMDVGVLIGRRG